MRFVMIKDPHFKFGFTNAIRKNYEKDLTLKLDQLVGYMKENNINTLAIPGDIFDESYSNRWKFTYFQYNVMILMKYFMNNNIKILAIPGNHDYFDGYEDICMTKGLVKLSTVYGMMCRLNIIENVCDDVSCFANKFKIIDNTIFTGVKYMSDLNKVREKLSIINNYKTDNGQKLVVMLHQNVTPKSVNHITEFTYEELAKSYPNVDVFLLGHYHIGYEPMKIGNTWFINPYNFTRVNREYEVRIDKHIPQFVDINITDDGIDVKQIDLKVRSFEDAFVDEYKSFVILSKESIKNDDIKINLDTDDTFNMSDSEIIQTVAEKYGLNDNETINYVMDVMNNLKNE